MTNLTRHLGIHSRRVSRRQLWMLFAALFFGACGCEAKSKDDPPLSYEQLVLADEPVAYFRMSGTDTEPDITGNGHSGRYFPANAMQAQATLPSGVRVADFNGIDQYLEIPNSRPLSIANTGQLTFEALLRPDVLEFTHQEGSGYVHWAGKGEEGKQEYALRMYSKTNAENPPRPNRMSGYAFNLSGGLGSGSYFQDAMAIGEWIHVAVVFDTRDISSATPTGTVTIYKNGAWRHTTPLKQYGVVPALGTAPLRIGTRDLKSYFAGAIGSVAIYDKRLPAERILMHSRRVFGF